MSLNNSIFILLKRLWIHITRRRRLQFAFLLFLMVLSTFAEMLSIGAVMPFLSVLTNPQYLFEVEFFKPMLLILDLSDPTQLLVPITIAFCIAALLAGIMRLLLLWVSTRLSFSTGADLSLDMYKRTLYQPYRIHCKRSSSEVIDGISIKANGVIYNTIMPVLMLISSIILLISILAFLLILEPAIAIKVFCGLGLIYMLIVKITRKHILSNSNLIACSTTKVIKSLQEGLGGIRDILIDNSQSVYCKIYRDADTSLRHAQASSLFIALSPRYGIEALGIVLIAGLAFSIAQKDGGISAAVPILGALALGGQRLLPVIQQAYGSWVQINSGRTSLKDALDLLDQPLPFANNLPSEPIPFSKSIALRKVSFFYEKGPYILKDINLIIEKGSRVGFIGATGSGKSTLLDIILGLLQPTTGALEIDDQPITLENHRSWQAHIAHVPQAIFLADSSIKENIAFGVPQNQIDFARVKWAARQAQILESIESWPNQYNTFVGERGIRLSGGQRQRIGIARALYKQANVIIFDEATSSLDNQTEQSVMEAISGLSKELTLLIVAHRLTTLKGCNQIVELHNGEIRRIGSYAEIVN